MNRSAHKEHIRPHRPTEIQYDEPKPLESVYRALYLPVKTESEDRIPVELDRDLADGLQQSRVGRREHLDLGALDVNFQQIDARLVDLRQDRLQPLSGYLSAPVEGAIVDARLG